jgi:hypothetical protein
MERSEGKAIVHAEADIGSSMFALETVNCDGLQLLGLAEVIRAHGMAALAMDMQAASHRRSPIEVVKGKLT